MSTEELQSEDVVDRAARFAIDAHSGQIRKSTNIPSVLHAMEAASVVATITDDREVIAAAFLHDTVEDTDTTAEDILREFGEKVAKLVASETEDKHPELPSSQTWKQRKIESLEYLRKTEDINVKILWLADKVSNMRSFSRLYLAERDRMWRYFNQKDPAEHEWYYRSVAETMPELADTAAYREYMELIDSVFGKQ